MKFAVSSGELLNRLQTVGKVIAPKNALPILDNFLFTISGNELTILASDCEVTLQTTLAINNFEGDGRIAVPGDKLLEFLKKLPEQPVTFSINEETSAIETITMSGQNMQIGQNADEYPETKKLGEDAQEFKISAEVLLAGITKAAFATGSDPLRPVMNGIFVDIDTDYITFVATDSHKLVRYTRSDVHTDITSSFVLNKKPANVLKSILNKNDGEISVAFTKENAVFTTPTYLMQCVLINTPYPQYRTVIPTDNNYKVLINREDLLNAISRVAIYADSSSLVKLEISSNQIQVMAQDLDFSTKGNEKVACQYDGNDLSIGFKASFFIEVLSNMSATDIVIELGDQARAGIMVPATKPENEDELMLLMPMKI